MKSNNKTDLAGLLKCLEAKIGVDNLKKILKWFHEGIVEAMRQVEPDYDEAVSLMTQEILVRGVDQYFEFLYELLNLDLSFKPQHNAETYQQGIKDGVFDDEFTCQACGADR